MKTALLLLLTVMSFTVFAQKQGIEGKVLWVTGNQMPGPGKKSEATPVVKEILFYKAVNIKDAKQTDGFFTTIHGELMAKTCSKKDGSFKVKLPPGTYSVFVKEPEGMFANSFDQEGVINPVVVSAEKMTWHSIDINYTAAY